MQEEIAAKKVELEGLKQEIQKGRAAERKLAQFREEVKRLELELAKLLQILPSKRNTEELIKRIETLTRQGDFTLQEVHARASSSRRSSTRSGRSTSSSRARTTTSRSSSTG